MPDDGSASFICAAFMAVLGTFWLNWLIKRARERGERFDPRPGDPDATRTDLPHPALAMIPLGVVLGVSIMWHESLGTSALILALLAGSLAAALLNFRTLREPGKALAAASTGALVAVGNTAAVVGFGAVAAALPAFVPSCAGWRNAGWPTPRVLPPCARRSSRNRCPSR